jgi:hypothetical protein
VAFDHRCINCTRRAGTRELQEIPDAHPSLREVSRVLRPLPSLRYQRLSGKNPVLLNLLDERCPRTGIRDASAIVTPLIARFHGPADSTWVIACDEPAWYRIEGSHGAGECPWEDPRVE